MSFLSAIEAKSPENTGKYFELDLKAALMDTASLVQPGRQLEFPETVQELAGTLELPEHPSTTAGYADIYRGLWITPHGERVQVAIKELRTLIPNDRETEPEALKRKADLRLKREAFVWSQTTHPNLHPLFGYCSRPRPRLISPWCSQGNLKDYLEANPALTRCDKLRLIFQTACGLEHLHSRIPPICHADIKPENVLINDWYGPALSDFGLSRVVQDLEARSGFTTSETVKGTVRYMANELFAGHKPSPESDVYAFGGLILTVMSGKAPFEGLLKHVILRRVVLDEPPIPKDHPYLPGHDPLWKLMRRCWNNDPTARPTMQEVLRELLGQIIHEESNSGPRLDLASPTDDGADEHRDNISGTPEHGGNAPSLTTNAAPPPYSLSGVAVAEVERNAVPRETLLATRKTLKSVLLNSKVIPVIGKYIGAASEVGLSLVEIVESTNKSENPSKGLKLNPWRLADVLQNLGEQSRQHRGGNIGAGFTEIKKELEFAQGKIMERYCSNLTQNEFSSVDRTSRGWCQGIVQKVLEEIQLLVTMDTTSFITEFENTEIQEQTRHLLNRLGDGNYGAQGNALADVICLPGTRLEILERIDGWIRDTTAPERVLWIRGMAGRGKSTIASTVAHNWQSRASCAIFHFRRGHDALNGRIVCALARQLGSSLIPEVRKAVLESVQENGDIADQRLEVQFETLFVIPLSKLGHPSRTVLFIVDALDESRNSKDAVDFVKLIDRHSSLFPTNVKFLLTCRPEAQLLRALEPRKWQVEDLDTSVNVVDDLAQFIRHGCKQIREDHGIAEDWPASSDIRNLVEMSQGLFQWARTVITYIGNGSPVNRLRDLLRGQSTWNGLDDLYHQILSKAFDNVRLDAARQAVLYSILGTLVVAPYPVSLEVVAALYGDHKIFEGVDQEGVIEYLRQDILVDLNSLLLIPTSPTESMLLMHSSIRDLLINERRCKEQVYYVDVRQHHERLANLCLVIMVRCLKENMCDLPDLSKPNSEVQDAIERQVSMAIRYCCRAWSIHLTEAAGWSRLLTEGPNGQEGVFEMFSKEKLLYWLEVMSLIGATTEAIVIAQRVYLWLSRSLDRAIFDSKSLTTLWNDVQRFITAFSEPISFGALHIYASALSHCPQMTQLWACYGGHAKIRTLRGVQPLTWPANLWTRAVGADVHTIAFSPDGAILASGSSDHLIRFWDAQTGTPLGQPLTGHNGYIRSVAFSLDGKVLASGSDDCTIRLWDAETGTPLAWPLTGHNGQVGSVVFSPDGKVLASGSDDCMIRWWDAQTGTPLGQPLTGHSGYVGSIAFSPNGKVLASGSDDRTIRLWDARTGVPLCQPLEGHNGYIRSVAFSPVGKILASGSSDSTIRLWDAQTGTPIGLPLTGHNHYIRSVAFSPDGKVLASGSWDDTIRLWDAETGTPLGQPLTGHNGYVGSVAFSPDGKVLASGSADHTIRLWDAHTGPLLGQPPTSPDRYIRSVAFSPPGKVLATGSSNGTIQMWDAQTGMPLGQPLTGHSGSVGSVAFSPDDKVLASGSDDGTIRLWDARTGKSLGWPLAGSNGYIRSVAFSPDGKTLASGSSNGTIQLWDAQAWEPLGPSLTGHNHYIRSVAFSPDSKVLASESVDQTIRLWDVQTGTSLNQSLVGHNGSVSSVVFSLDGKVLASGSNDGTVRLWDAQTGTSLAWPLTGHSDSVRSVAFSPDGKALGSGSNDDTIRLWDAQTGMPLGQPLTGHSDYIRSVAFSPDSRVLASGSNDDTIRLWDVQTGTALAWPLTGHSDSVRSVAFSPDGTVLASGSNDDTIRLWDAQTGMSLGQPLRGHGDYVSSVAFSPDGKVLASGSDDRTIRLWDTETWTPFGQPLTGHNDFVGTVAFSPDGKVLASGSEDRTIRLWDAQTGASLGQPMAGHTNYVRSVMFSPDGKVLTSGSDDGTIRLWNAQTGAPLGQTPTGDGSVGSFVPISYVDPRWPSRLPYRIPHIKDHWVQLSSSRLFWLPSQYWPDLSPIMLLSGGTLVIESDGTLSVFDVSQALQL